MRAILTYLSGRTTGLDPDNRHCPSDHNPRPPRPHLHRLFHRLRRRRLALHLRPLRLLLHPLLLTPLAPHNRTSAIAPNLLLLHL